jgi:esterase/lipase superfamily enzyme
MNWPPVKVLMPIALHLFKDEDTHSFDETEAFLAARCDVTAEEFESEASTASRTRWISRVRMSWNNLNSFGLTTLIRQKSAQITSFGLLVAEHNPTEITTRYLSRFPEFSKSDYVIKRKERPAIRDAGGEGELRKPAIPKQVDDALLRDPRNVVVWFGTNRKPQNLGNLQEGFTSLRDTRTHFGRVMVNIPEGHRVGGVKGWILRRWSKGTRGLVVRSIDPLPEQEFWASIAAAIKPDVEENSMLFFLHGFWQTFEQAAIRTAQLKYDLKIPHAAFYSWPSKANLLAYLADSTSVEAAGPDIAGFLQRLGALIASKEVKLHIIAHSMGNRALLFALEKMLISLKGNKPEFTFSDIVFAAADVDRQVFVNSVSLTGAFSQRKTLYASGVDRALKKSGFLNRMARAGYLPPVTIAKGTDTIEVPKFDFNLLGHGYYASARPVLHDMFDLMHHSMPAANRQGIQPQQDATGAYWRLT